MASAVDKQPAAARLSAVAAAGCLPTATRDSQNSYTTLWDTTRDLVLMEEIERVFETNYSVYGARKVWRQRLGGRRSARPQGDRAGVGLTRISHQDLAVFGFSVYNQCISIDLGGL